jgi:phage shock protein A
MNVQAEVLRLLLTDLSKFDSEPTTAENSLRTFTEDLRRVADELGNELASALQRERSIAEAIRINRSECDEWEERAGMAADSRYERLVQRAKKWKTAHESILTALRDHQATVQKDLQVLQNQMAGLQAMAAHAKARLDLIIARRQQAGVR